MRKVSALTVKEWLSDKDELAFLDVREHGQYGEGHPFFVIPLPFSEFELLVPTRVPRRATRMVLLDEGNGIAEDAAKCAESAGYTNVSILEGGAAAWQDAGFTLYAGVNVPSKSFGELLEHERHTPRLSAEEVLDLQNSDTKHIILDGRPFEEYSKMSIPGGICCPNGELALRVHDLVPDDETTIVINCAGRTRSILGAQTLIDAGIRNPVFALENGTQGWFLSGFELANGETDKYPQKVSGNALPEVRATAFERAHLAGVEFLNVGQVQSLMNDTDRTTYLFDVRTREEFDRDGLVHSTHAPGGQLIQATDQWVGVRHSTIVLLDNDGIRAPMTAYWLAQLGHRVFVLADGLSAAGIEHLKLPEPALAELPDLLELNAKDLVDGSDFILDVRSSAAYKSWHIKDAHWVNRSGRVRSGLNATDNLAPGFMDVLLDKMSVNSSARIVLHGDSGVASLIAKDLDAIAASLQTVWTICLTPAVTKNELLASQELVYDSDVPLDQDRIDFLFFTAERHNGNRAASLQYLEWEVNLVQQLDEQELNSFNILSSAH